MNWPKKKIVIVGDSACGKTTLLERFYWVDILSAAVSCVCRDGTIGVTVDGQPLELRFFDIADKGHIDPIRIQAYSGADAILICFSVDRPESLENILRKWVPEVLHFCQGVSYFVLGCKTDLRTEIPTLESLKEHGRKLVTTERGQAIARQVGAKMYLECSATTGDGINLVFELVTRSTLASAALASEKGKKRSGCRPV
ncbi:GTP-binding protein Rho1 [Serendipita sp. 405]|nr:GTP-binding protein Rho1 [Serendipita sp. 397]KAG8796989.1 GTP-binding protein Rho1 [Serendipita sp. 398]KAG8866683.1 GTP-binding protein Rho1 [Serendipita sp. 405]